MNSLTVELFHFFFLNVDERLSNFLNFTGNEFHYLKRREKVIFVEKQLNIDYKNYLFNAIINSVIGCRYFFCIMCQSVIFGSSILNNARNMILGWNGIF